MITPNDGEEFTVPRQSGGPPRVYRVHGGRWQVAVGVRWFMCDPYVSDLLNVAAHWRTLWRRYAKDLAGETPNDAGSV